MDLLNLAIVTFTLLFGPAHPQSFSPVTQQDVQQPFAWSGSARDLTIELWLIQNGDSVFARGAYHVASTKKVGCGGETLPAKGLVTMRAKGSFASFAGRLLFDSGWTPPFRAARTGPTSMNGSISSVDRGPCKMTLHRVTTNLRGPPRL